MGFIRSSFSFMAGTLLGVYIAQNYAVPNVKTLVTTGVVVAKQLETQYRKPKDDD
ncbi:hypothetical protein BDL97_15G011100 [Sphagnum fallax]|jgi:hypothetical protein|nr:hypothetical protein BDL97_15G011100 [Sphagnum fallax]